MLYWYNPSVDFAEPFSLPKLKIPSSNTSKTPSSSSLIPSVKTWAFPDQAECCLLTSTNKIPSIRNPLLSRSEGLVRSDCPVCKLSFKNLKGMKQHMGKVHCNEEDKRFICSSCDKKFKSKYAIRLHTRQVHEKSTRVQCKLCGTYLYNRYILSKHMDKHQHLK
jgi:hypothetical protein